MTRNGKWPLAALAMLGLLAGCGGSDHDDPVEMRTLRVSVTNLTANQPLSPVLVSLHRGEPAWRAGAPASAALERLAEGGDGSALAAELAAAGGIVDASGSAPVAPGGRDSFELRFPAADDAVLTVATMLVNTNDGFTGLHGVRLRAGHTVSVRVNAYDAGSEMNNQLASHIPGPAGGSPFVRDPEGAVIQMHPGLVPGVGDIDTSVYGWTGPVAKITVAPKS